jgi:hypothetical protein
MHMQKELQEVGQAKSSTWAQCREVWKMLWSLKIPNVEKKILWRACHDILQTRSNLHRRKIIDDPGCPLCGLENETAFHILWQCPSAMDI